MRQGTLARERVIALWNLPRTPQHNPWVENLHGELKLELRARGCCVDRNPCRKV